MITERKEAFPVERVLLGVSGSIAAIMVAPGIMYMRQILGINNIRVIMTQQASTMVPASTMAAISGNRVLVDWTDAEDFEVLHIVVAKWAQVFIVMPATANILAKVANGIADDLLSTALLAADCPVVFAPGMNPTMWGKPSTQRNVAQLKADGYSIVPPEKGYAIADGQEAEGGMTDIPTIMNHVSLLLRSTIAQ